MAGQIYKVSEKGITLIEALVSTAIVAIGFIAIFQMVQYSIRSIDVSGERTKSNLLISMVAEDLISEKNATSPTNKVSLVDYLVSQEKNGRASWNAPSCVSGSSTNQSFTNTVDAKKYKWTNRFSKEDENVKVQEIKKSLRFTISVIMQHQEMFAHIIIIKTTMAQEFMTN